MVQFAFAAAVAMGQLYSGRQQQAMYRAQAAQAKLQGRSEAIRHKLEAGLVLRKLNETLATSVARASGANIDPFSGSALSLQNYALREGGRDYEAARDNATIAQKNSEATARMYEKAGKAAWTSALVQAAGTLGMGAYAQGQAGWPSFGGNTAGGSMATTSFNKMSGTLQPKTFAT